MAAINSHRKRQVYADAKRDRRNGGHHNQPAPREPYTMMPGKNRYPDDYYSFLRRLADLNAILTGQSYLNNMEERSISNGQVVSVWHAKPAGVTPYDGGSTLSSRYPAYNSDNLIYQAAGRARGSSGFYQMSVNKKKVPGTYSYSSVVEVGSNIGGNIKSRQGTLKAIGGMWRAKK